MVIESIFIADDYIRFAYSFKICLSGLHEATKACEELGNGWKVTRKTGGSIVCSKVEHWKNCQKCDVWRLYVWEDGACEKLQNSRCTPYMTKSGKYYCGYEPCRNGVLQYGGEWFESSSSSGSLTEPGEQKSPVSSLFPFITI